MKTFFQLLFTVSLLISCSKEIEIIPEPEPSIYPIVLNIEGEGQVAYESDNGVSSSNYEFRLKISKFPVLRGFRLLKI